MSIYYFMWSPKTKCCTVPARYGCGRKGVLVKQCHGRGLFTRRNGVHPLLLNTMAQQRILLNAYFCITNPKCNGRYVCYYHSLRTSVTFNRLLCHFHQTVVPLSTDCCEVVPLSTDCCEVVPLSTDCCDVVPLSTLL